MLPESMEILRWQLPSEFEVRAKFNGRRPAGRLFFFCPGYNR